MFGGNDVPGVMVASAMRTYANRYAAAPGKAIVGLHQQRFRLSHGARSDARGRPCRGDRRQPQAMRPESIPRGVPVIRGGAIVDVKGGQGRDGGGARRSSRPSLATRSRCRAAGARSSISPATAAPSPQWNEEMRPSCRPMSDSGLAVAGAAGGPDAALRVPCATAPRRRLQAASDLGFESKAAPSPKCRDEAYRVSAAVVGEGIDGKAFVDYQNDVTVKDLPLAAHEGYDDRRARQALHDGRHGDRPGQARQCQCQRHPRRSDRQDRSPRSAPRPSGPIYTPVAVRRLRRALHRPSFPAGAQDAAS